ncbi:hypothetical protein MKW98_030621 [Papaver atlanticum]|uniref:CRAL-TRIO domain-containing protein n=1 Tax=Papaver atlanticum TaxID=357466 RepID=A0AAD4XGN1_9MAGN|nr:hypothetical protein MKW98_030621 [Papaver atlanticum]
MLIDCINWRMENKIDTILIRPIAPAELYKAVRDSQLLGFTYDKSPVDYYVQSHIQINEYRDRVVFPQATKKYGRYIGTCLKVFDMTGLKLSAVSQIKLLTTIATIHDLNYPEIVVTYYVVNTPYAFSKLWMIVKKLLQEETQRKIQVLKEKVQGHLGVP